MQISQIFCPYFLSPFVCLICVMAWVLSLVIFCFFGGFFLLCLHLSCCDFPLPVFVCFLPVFCVHLCFICKFLCINNSLSVYLFVVCLLHLFPSIYMSSVFALCSLRFLVCPQFCISLWFFLGLSLACLLLLAFWIPAFHSFWLFLIFKHVPILTLSLGFCIYSSTLFFCLFIYLFISWIICSKVGISCHRSFIEYNEMAQRTTRQCIFECVFHWGEKTFTFRLSSPLQIDAILCEGFAKESHVWYVQKQKRCTVVQPDSWKGQ